GKGGMGEVWRATDEKLGREVALKVLPEDFADDADRHSRFEREAKVLGSLNHPNIATLYGLEHFDGSHVLVMELVEGEGLDEVIARGPIPIDEAIRTALQIAEALEAAHEAGIVHRDLKPANIRVRPDGTVKVLDFGLAKTWESGGGDSSLSLSPTLTQHATAAGVILGTAAYMAPEQAAGTATDHRADIWAFGVVLWEMLTGNKLFAGETISHVMASVLKDDVDLDELPPETPRYLKTLIGRCLRRKRKQRLQAIGDARIALEEAAEEESERIVNEAKPAKRSPLSWILTSVAGMAAVIFGVLLWGDRGEETRVVRSSIPAPPGTVFHLEPLNPGPATVSPDGRKLVFTARDVEGNFMLYLRSLDQSGAHALAGTERGHYPFWSPDSRWIGFFANGKMKKIKVNGGPPVTICDAPDGKGGTWNTEGVIVFTPDSATTLHRVAAVGGESIPISELDLENGDNSHRQPRFLPDGRHLMYYARSNAGDHKSKVRILGLQEGGSGRDLVESNATAWFAAGHLLFVRDDMLMAQPFDPGVLDFTGDAFPVAEDVVVRALTGVGVFSASDDGVLVYQTGSQQPGIALQWFNRNGLPMEEVGEPAIYQQVSLSPDGSTAAVVILDTVFGTQDIWMVDLERGIRTRFTFDRASDTYPVWSPDGESLIFASRRDGPLAIYRKSVAGHSEVELVYSADVDIFPNSWSPDARYVAFQQPGKGTAHDFWILDLEGGPSAEVFYQTQAEDGAAMFSPDGRWITYFSRESGQGEVYVTPFPGPGRRWQVSDNSGTWSQWSSDGKEIFYQEEDGLIKSVAVDGRGDSLIIGPAEDIVELDSPDISGARFSFVPGAQSFLACKKNESQQSDYLDLVVGWTEELSGNP
ncbi:MAG: protein kinase, partial [Acidobacteriota bacterium]